MSQQCHSREQPEETEDTGHAILPPRPGGLADPWPDMVLLPSPLPRALAVMYPPRTESGT